jgi:hypothetical protein
MDIQQQKILDFLIGYWKEQFNLIPVVEIADTFEIPPSELLQILEAMATEGLVEMRAAYVLPSKGVLKAHFEQERQDFGHYKNLLHLGVSQAELFRFRPTILDHYRQDPDVEVKPDVIVTKPRVLRGEDVHPVYIRYRWATGATGERYLLVNLWDLAELSKEGQALWAGYELKEKRRENG